MFINFFMKKKIKTIIAVVAISFLSAFMRVYGQTKQTILILLVILSTSGCSLWFPREDDFLTIPKTPYTSNNLRLDGFYYQKWEHGTKYSNVVYLYNNGVVFQMGGYGDLSELTEYAGHAITFDVTDKNGFWGLFQVESNTIVYESWVGTQLGYLVYREEGDIINDTTFVMKERSRMNQGIKTETTSINYVYCFKEYSPKPDSTNTCIP